MVSYNVGFVFGGRSAEREVSVVTMLQLKKLVSVSSQINAYYFYLSPNGKDIFMIDEDNLVSRIFERKEEFDKVAKRVTFLFGGTVRKSDGLMKSKVASIDAVINCCHGGIGESGALAGYFETLGIPFSTSSHLFLGLSMDKNLFKCALKSIGVRVPKWVYATNCDIQNNCDDILIRVKKMGYPVIVKPNSSGSSLGVTIVHDASGIMPAIDIALNFDNSIIIEKLVENKIEFNCAVVGNEYDCICSDVDQIQQDENNQLFSFSDKYIGESGSPLSKSSCKKSSDGMASAKRLLPAPISKELESNIKETALKVFSLIHGSGVARVDFLFDAKKEKLYVGEINAVPGSMALYFFKKSNMDGLMLINRLVQIAIENKKLTDEKYTISSEFIPAIFKKP